jgi:renalase
MPQDPEVTVVGAGIAGIAAACRLTEHGRRVLVVEKSSSVGGRMASRRSGSATFDHGAQFFTTRSETFTSVVERAVDAGVVKAWTHGFDDPPDGFPRWSGTTAMTDLVRWLAESAGIDVELGREIVDLRALRSRAHVLTAPVPQSLAVLSFSRLLPAPPLHVELAAIAYKPTVSVLVELAQSPPGLPPHGGAQYADHPELAFVTDNRRKGISDEPAVTIHLSNELSRDLWNSPDDLVAATALELTAEHLAGATVLGHQVHRWRYAGPVDVWPEPTVCWGDEPVIALAGEAFAGPKVEGAYLSGIAAADAVHHALR